MLQEFELR
jgi:Ulp1 family protease